jgi:hypothetical protein
MVLAGLVIEGGSLAGKMSSSAMSSFKSASSLEGDGSGGFGGMSATWKEEKEDLLF